MLGKVQMHCHTAYPGFDDGQNPFDSVLEEHYRQNFVILCITGHNVLTTSWDSVAPGRAQPPASRLAEFADGVGRGGIPMLYPPMTNELTMGPGLGGVHMNSYMTNVTSVNNFNQGLSTVQGQSGSGAWCQINHPFYLGVHGYPDNNTNVTTFAGHFTSNSACIGHEINEPADRDWWDSVLTRTMPNNRRVYGINTDDSHANRDTGWYFSMVWMPEMTVAAFRTALLAGQFYGVGRLQLVSGRSQWQHIPHHTDFEFPETHGAGAIPVRVSGFVPVIDRIAVAPPTITISARHYTDIQWFTGRALNQASGTNMIASGASINTNSLAPSIVGSYVRAAVIGPAGVAFTQPYKIPLT